MTVKTVNNLIKPDNIILALLIFKAYPCITRDSSLLLFITKQAKVIYKTIKKVWRFYTKQQVNNALAIRNRLNTKPVLTLLLQSNVWI